MPKLASDIPLELKAEVTKALSEWVNSLPSAKANSMAMCVSGIEFTPIQILDEVEHETDFGKQFLTGLFALHSLMIEDQPGTSVVDLIRRSIKVEPKVRAASHTTR